MKKILAIAAVAMLLVLSVLPSASAAGAVVGTYSVADLGQGIWGGGPLFADGTAGGGVALSAANGQIIGKFRADTWSWLAPGVVGLCFNVTMIKPAGSPSRFCAPLPVTGTPMKIDENGDGVPDFIMRLTLN